EQETKGCFISNCISELGNQDAQVHRFLVENKDQMVNTFKILIQEAQQQGEIDASKDAKTLALYLFSNLNGLRITSMIESDIQGVTDLIISVL
ncbi:MAG: TetR family transcriptional regulator C-terminal domain-containing protein, partial [Bacteroidota bacterium]